ncbi:MAG: hypothetical protein IJQ56_11650, partial [Synergistaceae bacterium]|nr:hypothetical protein [Synergistaceae bacterium]
ESRAVVTNYDVFPSFNSDNHGIHPNHKQEVGERMELVSESLVYGKQGIASAPYIDDVVIKDGKSREVTRKLYPSYVLVEMIMDEQSWYTVRHTSGVTGFIGAGTHPMPLSQEEVDRIMTGMKKDSESPKVELDIKPGDIVRVIAEGEMNGFTGPVVEINAKKGKVRFKSEVLGGAVLETDYKALEKI